MKTLLLRLPLLADLAERHLAAGRVYTALHVLDVMEETSNRIHAMLKAADESERRRRLYQDSYQRKHRRFRKLGACPQAPVCA